MISLKSPLSSFSELMPSSWARPHPPAHEKLLPRPRSSGLNLMVFLNAAIMSVGMTAAGAAESGTTNVLPVKNTSTSTYSQGLSGTALHFKLADILSSNAKAAIGEIGFERIRGFELFRAGWDGSGSKPLQRSSVLLFNRFMNETGIRPEGASVFMSSYGELILAWQDGQRQVTELKFRQHDVEYFNEAEGRQNTVEPAKFRNLAETLGVPRHPSLEMQRMLDFASGSAVLNSSESKVTIGSVIPSHNLTQYQLPNHFLNTNVLSRPVINPHASN